jgi:hypothetical protein
MEPQVFQCALPASLFERLSALSHQENKEELSYWVPIESLDTPSSVVEEVIQCVRQRLPFLTSGAAGVEWWIHKRPVGEHMHMHFDRGFLLILLSA